MKFVKMHGCGNDYVLVDGFREKVEDPARAAERLCRPRFGIGADGFILVEPSCRGDARMRIFNADGNEAEMCGNGIRCAARLLIQEGRLPAGRIVFETKAGLREVRPCTSGEGERFEVDMGRPAFFQLSSLGKKEEPAPSACDVQTKAGIFWGYAVSMGNPHFVIFVDDLESLPIKEYGPAVERHALFEASTNVSFVKVMVGATLKQRTWERGVGETLACGTGASAAAAVAIKLGRVESPVTVKLAGGDLIIRWEEPGPLFMAGGTAETFRGEVDD